MPAASSRLPRAGLRPTRARRSSRRATSPPRATSRRTRAARAAAVASNSSPPVEPVQHRRHPPREVLGAPDAAQARLRVARRARRRRSVPVGDRVGEHANVGDGEVQPLRAGRRDDVRGVAREEEPPVLHRLDDEAAHAGHALLDDRPLVQRPAGQPEPRAQLLPDALVRPLVERLVGPALEVEPRELRRAHAVEREAALVVRVDELVVRRRAPRRGCRASRTGTRATSRAGRRRGIDSRQTPWKPSQPATTSHSSVVLGAARAGSGSTAHGQDRRRRPRPRRAAAARSASRAAMRSLTTSCWP